MDERGLDPAVWRKEHIGIVEVAAHLHVLERCLACQASFVRHGDLQPLKFSSILRKDREFLGPVLAALDIDLSR